MSELGVTIGVIFIFTAVIVAVLLFLIQALVQTELQIAEDRLANKQVVLSKQDENYAKLKKNETVLIDRLEELEGSRQDLFNYIIKQEKIMEQLRSSVPENNGTPQV